MGKCDYCGKEGPIRWSIKNHLSSRTFYFCSVEHAISALKVYQLDRKTSKDAMNRILREAKR